MAATVLLLVTVPAHAGCADGPWPLDREAAALARPASLPVVATGARVPVADLLAFTLTLRPLAEASLPVTPARSGNGAGMAGFVYLTIATPGLYQVTVPEPVWLDVIVDGTALAPESFAPAHDCPGVRKSVRFRLPAGAAILQVSRTSEAGLALVLTSIP